VGPTHGYAVSAESGERLTFGGGTVLVKAATPALTVWEELPPLLDTPLHVHQHEDELFQIFEGEHASTAAAIGSTSALVTSSPCRAACPMPIAA
jgi:hypothetical protein